jgi:dipeptidyl aminopeptidase/acylaminoacyl peptidase
MTANGAAAEFISHANVYDDIRISPEGLFWIERRGGGRDVLVRWTRAHGPRDVIPDGFSVASRVNEFGGGAWTLSGAKIWFCNATDQRLYQSTGAGTVPIDPVPSRPQAVRYADLCADPDGRYLWGVRERHERHGVLTEVVRIPAVTHAVPRVVASGWDFYASPRPSPDGRHLSWLCWNAPCMPWDGTCLYVAEITAAGDLTEPVLLAGGQDESVFQPSWSPDGVLHFISDRSGWWGLYAWRNGEAVPVLVRDAELGVAQWRFGYATYAFLDSERIAIIAQQGSRNSLEVVERGQRRLVTVPYTSIRPYISAHGSDVAILACNADEAPSVAVVDVDRGTISKLAGAQPAAGGGRTRSCPEPFAFAARDGTRIHGLFYPPRASSATPPPLVIKAHGGPTANYLIRLDMHTQYLSSNGFAVAEIDYRGSTGYGRSFRNSLRGEWGERDALDCADAAEHLAAAGKADPRRIAIWGLSAGGYTALRALIRTHTFAACIARSPLIEPRTWREMAPKFQAHHADTLIGPWPEAAASYQARSVLANAHAISSPVLLFHGGRDRLAPIRESEALARTLGGRARLVVFPAEGHMFRSREVVRQVLELELDFLGAMTAGVLAPSSREGG